MALSDLPQYQEFIDYFHRKEYDMAGHALYRCIDIAKTLNDKDTLVSLKELQGEVFFCKGDIEKAYECYLEAENIAEQSLLSKYHTAKFLAEKARSYGRAIEKCAEVIAVASSKWWPETEEDFSSNYYLAQCYALQGYCYCLLGDLKRAQKRLSQLFELKGEYGMDYVLRLCDCLIDGGHFIKEAKEYLSYLLNKLSEDEERGVYEDFIREIKKRLLR